MRPYDVIHLVVGQLYIMERKVTRYPGHSENIVKNNRTTGIRILTNFIFAMSDLFRRASEAFHPRQRQGSADSTEAPDPPDARRPSETEPLKQKAEPSQPESHVNEAFAGTANGMISLFLV